jgi:hypothetical protein
MVLLDAARRNARPPVLAYFALGLGIAATLAANLAAGLASGPLGAIVAAWPAPALVISYELLMYVIRSAAASAESTEVQSAVALNGHARQAAGLFAADLAAGSVPTIRRIRAEMHVGQPRAQQVHEYLASLARTR